MSSTYNRLCLVGLALAAYAVYVEWKVDHLAPDEEFTALCDIESIGASCSATFQLPMGRMFSYIGLIPKGSLLDLPNASFGILYYTWKLLLHRALPQITLLITTAAFLSTVFLAYQLVFVVHEFCILCWSTHVVNTCLMVLALRSATAKSKSA